MKLTFECIVKMTDELPDSEVEKIYPVEDIVKTLTKVLKEGLSEKGTIDISDYSIDVS